MRTVRATVAAVVAIASLSVPMFAQAADAVGRLTSASVGTFVNRDGKLLPAYANQTLYAGDRVITRDKASAKVAFTGCAYNMAPASMLAVTASSCGAKQTSFAAADGDGGGGFGGMGSDSLYWIGAAGLVIAAAVIVADDKHSSP